MKLVIRDLSKTFFSGERKVTVLDGLDLESAPGERLAIVGPSGSGKSTLLALLAGLDQPTSGSILLDQCDIAAMNQSQLTRFRSKNIGIIFQQFHLMPELTALENVLLPLELSGNVDRDKAVLLLHRVGLGDRLDHFPGQLSGGECQRVAIARALVVEPALLLADEPTGNLDKSTAGGVADLIFELFRQLEGILILVTHNVDLAGRCDRILRLESGSLHS